MVRPELNLTSFLERFGSADFTRPASGAFAHPLPCAGGDDGRFLYVFGRNHGDAARGRCLQDVFSITRVEIMDDRVAPPLLQSTGGRPYRGELHKTGAFRDLIYRLETDLPRYGYRELSVEYVGNGRLVEVLHRYGFKALDESELCPTMTKPLDRTDAGLISQESAIFWQLATNGAEDRPS